MVIITHQGQSEGPLENPSTPTIRELPTTTV